MNQEYRELLLDPRWQRRRCEVLMRDDFTCQECWTTNKTLCVHHNYYDKDLMPWDYRVDDEWPHALETLCVDCHAYRDEIRRAARECVWIADRIKESEAMREWWAKHPLGKNPEHHWLNT